MAVITKPRGIKTPLEVFTECQSALDPNCTRDEWVKILMAAKAGDDSPAMEAAVMEWSAGGASFNPRDFGAVWRSIEPNGGVGFGTLVKMAQDAGWRPDHEDPRRSIIDAPRSNGKGAPAAHAHEAAAPVAQAAKPSQSQTTMTAEQAQSGFGKLFSVRCDGQARQFFRDEYGIDPDLLPDFWRVLEHSKMGRGVVYLGQASDGSPVYKFKTFARNEKGKRNCTVFYGGAGAQIFERLGAPLVLVGGEEKGLAASLAGFTVIASMVGEKAPDAGWIRRILEMDPPRIIVANDHDQAGEKANQETAKTLEAAGFPVERLALVQWPENTPERFDLNDAMKAGGVESVRNLIEGAKAWEQSANRALDLASFLSLPRPALHYWIRGVLPERGKLTISAVAKGYKTTLLIELGLCASAGRVQYLNFEFGDPARVLLVQPELSDGLMAERLAWILKTAPEWLNRGQAMRNLHVLETFCGRPSLWKDHPRGKDSRREVETAIERTGAQILLVDSLYMSFAGMDENAADQMTLALDYLGELANRFGVAVILSHHFNKSGTVARGSSVYQGWGETDLSISTLEKEPDVVKVEALMRCAFPKGFPAYWRKPDEATAWFDLMPEDWAPAGKGGRPQSAGPAIVPMVLKSEGRALRWAELHAKVMEAGNVKKSRAEELIREAKSQGLILAAAGVYAVPMNQPQELFNGVGLEK